ncbi:spore wall protein 2-like [Osmia bicornis bicornis]|uniref:spore wall protein 2-like n=1 Tax=Osmia bicornis bicornis TaxID=1437191 RepID=UPI0010F7C8E0|nr:spore wall protein 2-like [Osmia bicornis bicornis]
MWCRLIVLFFIFCCSIEALGFDDVVSVESLRRDVREPLPFATEVEDLLGQGNSPANDRASKKDMKNVSGKSDEGGYYKTYGSDAEGEKGYLKATFSKGNHGYKNLDTFHKQDGDKYAFEKHIAYGKAQADKKSGHNVAAASRSSKGGDYEGAGTIVDSHYTADEGDHGDHSGEHVEGDHSGYSEGAHYTDHGPESSSYGHSEGYATKDGDHGSYESHSSYSRDYGDEQGDQGGHYY